MRGVSFESARTVEHDGWNARNLKLYSHAGTHMDAQTHFAAGAETIDQIPLDRCMGSAWLVKLDGIEPKTSITVKHLGKVAEKFVKNDSLLLRTGWSRHVDDEQYYRNTFPRISEELAEWCVKMQVKILGVEPPSVADVNCMEELTRVHEVLLGGRVGIVESLTNLHEIKDEKVFFCAFPLRIEGGDGCPCRAFAVEGGSLL